MKVGTWEPIQRYTVSNSWLIKGDRKVLEFLSSQHDIIAELHLDRPFKAPSTHFQENYFVKVEDDGMYTIETESKYVPNEYSKSTKYSDSIAEWNIHYIGASNIWHVTTGKNMIYASADTGVDWKHPILESRYAAHLWKTKNSTTIVHDYAWWDGVRATHKDIYNNSSEITDTIENVRKKSIFAECPMSSVEPCDDTGHGTHTTSTVVGT